MASHQTTNFQLCQWEADDEVLRTDFNADNLKIENALSAVKAVADKAYTTDNKPYVVGTYTGNGSTGGQTIDLGFAPSYVRIMDRYPYTLSGGRTPYMGLYQGEATRETPLSSGGLTCLTLTDTGFTAAAPKSSDDAVYPDLNYKNRLYSYIAFR